MVRKLLILLCFLSSGFTREVHAQTGIVTFTFDDASKSQYTNAFRIMSEYSMVGTLFVPTGNVDESGLQPKGFNMSWEEVRKMHSAGWEIGSHTHTHANLRLADDMNLFGEVAFSQRRITEEVGEAPFSLSTPFGEFDERVIAEIKRHYASHFRAWGGNEGFNPFLMKDTYDIGRFDVKSSHSAAEVCAAINRASKEGEWLVLEFHEVVGHIPTEYQISIETFTNILKCVRVLEAEKRVSVKTAKETIALMKGE